MLVTLMLTSRWPDLSGSEILGWVGPTLIVMCFVGLIHILIKSQVWAMAIPVPLTEPTCVVCIVSGAGDSLVLWEHVPVISQPLLLLVSD